MKERATLVVLSLGNTTLRGGAVLLPGPGLLRGVGPRAAFGTPLSPSARDRSRDGVSLVASRSPFRIPAEAPALEARLETAWRSIRPRFAASCSVNPRLERVVARSLGRRGIRLERVGRELKPRLRLSYRPAGSLGPDRIANVCGGLDLSPSGCIVVDCGTAITINVGSPAREFLGGAIAPGLRLSARALMEGTALLPKVMGARPPRAPARSTRGSIALGLVIGLSGLVDRLLEECLAPLDFRPTVLLTGGDAERLSPHLRTPHRVVPDLTLMGVLSIVADTWTSRPPS